MDFLPAKKDGEKKRKAPEKPKAPPKPKLSETSFRDLLQTTKLRFENGFKLFPQLEAEIEKKKNNLTAELIQLDIAQKDKPQEQQQKQCSVWTFMQDRLKQKKNEHCYFPKKTDCVSGSESLMSRLKERLRICVSHFRGHPVARRIPLPDRWINRKSPSIRLH